jgi:uncharacterized protein (TIGR02118 family)
VVKVISLMRRRGDMSLEEFRDWALHKHVEFGKALPGLREYRMSVVSGEDADTPYHAVSELWFDDEEAFAAAFATEAGKAAGADAGAHTESRTRLVTTEVRVI